ncbi:MAG: hypothetical protein JO303_01385 [Caulobacteraceae bacterium]|nr:hypothetical protein [Caulobacteraceae bacterium]
MKRLGLAAVMFLATLLSASFATAAIDPDQQKQGMKEAPAVVAAAQLPCTVSDAYFIGSDSKSNSKYYEVACKEGLGFVLGSNGKDPPTTYDCLMTAAPGPDGKPGTLACKLPENQDLSAALQPYVSKAGLSCNVDKQRFIGANATDNLYEVACAGGGGYVLDVAHNYGGAPKANNCTDIDASSNIACKLITRDQQFALIDKLAAASGKPCSIKDRRVVGSASDGSTYYEFACTDGSGFMVKADSGGKFSQAIDCGEAGGIGNGCTLTDAKQAMQAEAARYAGAVKAAGFNCDVAKSVMYPSADANTKVVEVACSNRPDGAVAFVPASGSGPVRVLNCLRSEVEGYKCTLSPTNVLYPIITAELKAKGRNSCVVSNARAMAATTSAGSKGDNDLIEVACADGGPGLVVEYGYGSDTPTEVMNCIQAKQFGGCALPRQKGGIG